MKFDELLNKDDRFQYLILKYLELNVENFISVPLICDMMGLSQFKVRQYLENLKYDVTFLSETASLTVGDNNEVLFENVDLLLIKKIRLLYLNRANQFILLQEVFFYGSSIEQYAEKFFISKTKAYEVKKELTIFLKHYGLKYKKSKIAGDELNVRNLLFGIYYEFFNGLKLTFPEEIMILTNQFIQGVLNSYQINIPDSKRIKLKIMIGILSVRIKQGEIINLSENIKINHLGFGKGVDLLSLMTSIFSQSASDLSRELSYLLLFLYGEGVIKKEELPFELEILHDSQIVAGESIDNILTEIKIDNRLEQYKSEVCRKKLLVEFEQIHLNAAFFYSSTETFYLDNQFTYFTENYPDLSRAIVQTLEKLVEYGKIPESIRNRLYYDYLFAVLKIIDVRDIEPKIYVCVDFSHGSNYTEYIANEILGFKNLNIELEKKITSKTHLYVSDIAVDRNLKAQIIWKNPPTTNDWESFGNQMIHLKNDKEVRGNE